MTRQLALLIAVAALAQDPYSQQREAMVRDHLEARGIRNADVLRVMRTTQRHLFVPTALRAMSYADHPLPIGHDATISQPYIVALMTGLLEPAARHRVLEIGTGSGYQAAVLSPLVHKVYTIEIVPELAKTARATLGRLGYNNVNVRQGDGFAGWPEEAPFDRIILTAAPEDVPATLINQLANNGRLVAPIGPAGAQELVIITKDSKGNTRRQSAARVAFVPMKPARP